jgi:hypothetical protein
VAPGIARIVAALGVDQHRPAWPRARCRNHVCATCVKPPLPYIGKQHRLGAYPASC